MVDRSKLVELRATLDDFFLHEQAVKDSLRQLPRVPIDRLFGIWDRWLAHLDANREAEDRERKALAASSRSMLSRELDGSFAPEIEEARQTSWPIYEKTTESLGNLYATKHGLQIIHLIDAFTDKSLSEFFSHDISHLIFDLTNQFRPLVHLREIDNIDGMRHNRQAVRHFLESYNRDPAAVLGVMMLPYKMLHYLATTQLGETPRIETFTPADIVDQIALILQGREPVARYSIVNQATASSKNELVVDAEKFSLHGNPGVFFSIVYNLAKNAHKKLSDKPDAGYKITIQAYEAPDDTYVITVADSGTPIDLNAMKEKIRRKINAEGLDGIALSAGAKARFGRWQKSDYAVTGLTVGDITDVAFLARMSGFDNTSDFSSGMGLYGISRLVENRGVILYGEDFDGTGGPVFTIILPKEFAAPDKILAEATAARLPNFPQKLVA